MITALTIFNMKRVAIEPNQNTVVVLRVRLLYPPVEI
jgi:hypothetical protein